jgi:cytochrome c553
MAAELTDEDVRNLGAYYASLPRSAEPAQITADAALKAKGEAVAGQHHCAACHMDDFRGKQAAASIANQREGYLAKALADYRSQARPSVGVAAMTEAASGLSDDEIAALAHYLATL